MTNPSTSTLIPSLRACRPLLRACRPSFWACPRIHPAALAAGATKHRGTRSVLVRQSRVALRALCVSLAYAHGGCWDKPSMTSKRRPSSTPHPKTHPAVAADSASVCRPLRVLSMCRPLSRSTGCWDKPSMTSSTHPSPTPRPRTHRPSSTPRPKTNRHKTTTTVRHPRPSFWACPRIHVAKTQADKAFPRIDSSSMTLNRTSAQLRKEDQ
jgi:hypothetical protein